MQVIERDALIVKQEPDETKREFLAKVDELEEYGWKLAYGKCYDVELHLAEIGLIRDY